MVEYLSMKLDRLLEKMGIMFEPLSRLERKRLFECGRRRNHLATIVTIR